MLQARGLMKFIESDYLANAKKNNSLSSNDLEKATKEQTLADSIIVNNLSSEALEMVNDLDIPFEIFKVLKQEYNKNETKDAQQWNEKLKKLKAKNPSECSAVLRKIKELFRILDKKGYKTGQLEKLRFIYFAMSPVIQNDLKFREEMKHLMQLKCKGIIFEEKEKSKPDMMDVDYVGKPEFNSNNKEISYINNKISNFKSNYCHICKEYGHDVSICNYNLKNPKRNKNINKNKGFTKSKKKQFNNKNRNRKYIGNLEYESDSSNDDISFNNIKPMFEKGI
ncbi:hypothetical protein H8356DRAFT_1383342 [Neocallimastix lanati (nom. inval.)]|nr:hypothetical protein H8356DRAFT_1383342 [Neocallimastix sp. JGI-2020a]